MYLNCHSYFSLKYGAMSLKDLLSEARQKGITSLALTDINNTSGILDFFRLASNYGIRSVAGIDFRNGINQQFVGLARNIEGFHELNQFLSHHLLSKEPIPSRAPEFQNAFVVYPFHTAPRQPANHEFTGVSPHDLFKFQGRCKKPVILFPVTFRDKKDFNAHRLLRAIHHNTLLSKLDGNEQANPGEIMRTEKELRNIYKDYPELLTTTQELLEQCSIDFEFGKNKNKKYFTGTAKQDYHRLMSLCYDGLKYRYPKADDAIIGRFESEIHTITELGYASYFLINHDIVSYAQRKNYFYVGRGSGANSMVAYLLRITDVDPIDLDLYFERFINPYRTSPPDFDIDFSWNDRDDVTDYIFHHSPYGSDHVALLATYSTFQENSVLRELGKVFGLPKEEIDSLTENEVPGKTADPHVKLIYRYAQHLFDFPSHLSIHAGGILISEKPVTYYTALENPPKGFPLTQFSMLEAEDVGLYKFDILSQRGLGKMKDAVDIIRRNRNIAVDIHNVKRFKEDEKVRANLQVANLIGCFYVESPAMRMLLTKLRASTYLDLVAASSIIRPGVAQSGMMREYILRFHHPEKRTYMHPVLEELMKETFGVMVYQEDVIKVAHHFAGLTLSEADMLRRGMSGKYRGRTEFDKVEKKFFEGCREKGYDEALSKDVWRQIESFAGYAFSKGHSASYAVESYQCMFLKTYYPLEYMVAVINNGGGFYSVEFYVHEARLCGGRIHAPEINKSEALTCIYGDDIYIGFHLVAELESNTVETVLKERHRGGVFHSLEDFMKRVSLSVEQLRILIRVGAFRFTGRTKKQLLWDIHTVLGAGKKTEVSHELFEVHKREFQLPELFDSRFDDAFDEIEILGFPLCSPFELLISLPTSLQTSSPASSPAPLKGRGEFISASKVLRNYLGRIISIVGYSVTRKRTRTKKGEDMCFGTFLDVEGHWIDTTHFPNVLKQYPFTGRGCYLITGKVVEEFGFYSLDVTEMKRLDFKTREDIVKEIYDKPKIDIAVPSQKTES
jgi:DNA polymerase III alpha subunit